MKRFIDRLWSRYLRRLPHFRSPKLLELPIGQRVILFAPHSDDEWLGCGGTLTRLQANDCQIRVVVLTDGALGDPEGFFSGNITEWRRAETCEALGAIGVRDVRFLDFPDGYLASNMAELDREVARSYDEFSPDWVLTTSPTEHHRDHVCTAYSVICHWLARGARERLLAYEVFGAIRVDLLVDITDVIALKRQLIRRYKIPLRYVDYESATVALARYRGMLLSDPLAEGFAEAFMDVSRRDAYGLLARGLLGIVPLTDVTEGN